MRIELVLPLVPRLPTTLSPFILIHEQPHPRYRGIGHVGSLSGKADISHICIFYPSH